VQRRDLSTILLATSATAALGMKGSAAQTSTGSGIGTAPCYARTAAEVAAGVTPTNIAYQQGDVRRYGADPSGATDSTTAIQDALDVGADVYIAAGNYTITAALSNSVQGRRIYGDGPKVSVLQPTGPIDTLVNAAPLNMVMMDNFGIAGDDTSLDGITQASGTSMTASLFQNIFVTVGGRAFYLFDEFNTQLINCNGSSFNNNVFELQGGNTTRLAGCYASQVPAGYYGYRLYGGAQLDSCTGIDTPAGGDWGLFGAVTSKGDPVSMAFYLSMTNCDVEDFNNYGVRLRGTGYAKISGGAVLAKAVGTYGAEFYVEYSNNLIIIENVMVVPKGATRTALAAIYMDADSYIYVIGDNIDPRYDVGGTIYSLPRVISTYPGYLQRAVGINNLDVEQLYSRYAGTVSLTDGSAAVRFANAQWDDHYCVLVTGNAAEMFTVTNKATTGFMISSSNAASRAQVDWMTVRTGT
jgi:Pectate lyase superfamily protein